MLPLMGEPESAYGGRLFSPTRRSFRTPSGGFLIFAQRGVCAAQGGGSSGEATDLRQASGSLAENQQQGPSEEEAGQPCTRCEAAPTRKYQIFCENCGDVLVPQYGDAGKADFSYFDFLQMAPTFDIDRAALDTKYKQFEKRLHPDKHVLANQTRVDEGLEADRVTDSDLLREVFELNEALEMVTSRAELEEFKRRVDALLDEDERDLSSRFRDKDFDGIRSLIHRYQMHAKLQESIKDWSPPE
ncbi:putative DNAJ domain-containing protein [Neospora caninum Liverpool]|uniref:Putative DNAJ domain-containing protein n=1 Tax=Neospora caninum (strain Liverpool) TaxID=572307 RepID=F0VBQ6_NEOCL|nr:putative DNAJ domain-containing protein [Neospora caninum Liverpool]CBZ51040.1 putative DNAJ domain-containing protein [Neospora caninum Liverpool]|eukprot:XP_003881073.1 putative DNAJ domain-containing protein [Neospora caninum Liverpool]